MIIIPSLLHAKITSSKILISEATAFELCMFGFIIFTHAYVLSVVPECSYNAQISRHEGKVSRDAQYS